MREISSDFLSQQQTKRRKNLCEKNFSYKIVLNRVRSKNE